MSVEINCLEVPDETVESVESVTEESVVEEPQIKYTKTGRIKKPTSEAQKEALRKAREAYTKKHTAAAELRKESELVMAQSKIKEQTERIERIKGKMKKEADPVVEPVVEVPEFPDFPDDPPPIVRQKAHKKKPVVVVQQATDSESEDDTDNIIYIKRRTKKKEAAKPAPVHNPFSTAYRFYDRSAMS